MNKKILYLILIYLIFSLSGCVENNNTITVPKQDLALNSTYVGTMGSIDLYKFRIESMNATCIGGEEYPKTHFDVAVLDCKYD